MGKFVDKICTEQNVDLIVFPELATTGYELGLHFTEVAERVPGHAVNLLAQRAADYSTHIVFGMVTKEKVESILYNAAIVIGPDGEMLGEYRKLHLPGEERLAFRPGYRLPVFETAFGQIGVLLGWDLAFPGIVPGRMADLRARPRPGKRTVRCRLQPHWRGIQLSLFRRQ
jgi:predicted amidohydrolase